MIPAHGFSLALVSVCFGVRREIMWILWQADSGGHCTAELRAEACGRPGGWELSWMSNESGHGMEFGCHLLHQASQTERPLFSNSSNLCIPSSICLKQLMFITCELVLSLLKDHSDYRSKYLLASLLPWLTVGAHQMSVEMKQSVTPVEQVTAISISTASTSQT